MILLVKILLALISFFCVAQGFAETCEERLSHSVFEKAASYRLHAVSPVKTELISLVAEQHVPSVGGAVVSFGSGADVFNLVAIYPNATEYHLVDVLRGWGAGPGEVVLEVIRRLRHIAKDNRVSLISKGFTLFVPEQNMSEPQDLSVWKSSDPKVQKHFKFPNGFWQMWDEDLHNPKSPYLSPMVIEFKLADDQEERPRKLFLHPLDFDESSHLQALSERITVPLTGLFVSYIKPPDELEMFLKLLRPGGYFIFEMYYDFDWVEEILEKYGETARQASHDLDYDGKDVHYLFFRKHPPQ